MFLVWSFPKRWGGGDKWRPCQCPLIIYCGVLGGSHSWEKENIDHWVLRILTCPLVLASSTVRSHGEVCGTTCQASRTGVLFFWSVAAGYVQVNNRPAIPLRSGLELQLTFDFVLNWIITYYPVYLLAFVSWVWKTTDGGRNQLGWFGSVQANDRLPGSTSALFPIRLSSCLLFSVDTRKLRISKV